MSADKTYWFPAKRYGWGWGPPTVWQGWVVLGLFAAAQAVLAWHALPHDPLTFAVGSVALVLPLIVICYVKGEPPAWRWGDRGP